jgi:hypothetical protein
VDDNAVLSDRQYRFVVEYCKDYERASAYIRAGYSEKGADQGAERLLKNVEIQAAIESHKRDLAEAARATVAFVTRKLREIADSDRRGCCRFCYGIDHRYQWTETEYGRALDKALKAGSAAPDFGGGFGYVKNREPLEDCPECQGEGIPLAREEVKPADRMKALDLLGRYLGMVIERKELSGPGGGPVPLATVNVNELTDEQLAALCGGRNEINGGTAGGTLMLEASNPLSLTELETVSSP